VYTSRWPSLDGRIRRRYCKLKSRRKYRGSGVEINSLVKAGRRVSERPSSNSLCLTSSFGSHVATLAAALLKSATTCIFWESLITTSALHATSATTSVSTTACERGITTAKRIWPGAAFLYCNLFCANSMRVGSNCSIVSSGICKFHEGTILLMSASSLSIWDGVTCPLSRDIKVLQFAIFLQLGSKLAGLNLFVHVLDVCQCV
jgi:hypothetical protein